MATQSSPVKKLHTASPRSRWVAIGRDNKIISEGTTADSARKKALKKTEDFLITFVPKEGATYVL